MFALPWTILEISNRYYTAYRNILIPPHPTKMMYLSCSDWSNNADPESYIGTQLEDGLMAEHVRPALDDYNENIFREG